MAAAYYAITDVGPYTSHQVVVFEDGDGWIGTGYFVKLIESAPRRGVTVTPEGHLLIPVKLRD